MHRRQRPAGAGHVGDRMKLHRRRVRCDGRDLTVITLRPDTDCRFSTNFYHGTWHILGDWRAARLLGRLLWGLAYQRRPGTLVLIDRPHIDPNPFDGRPGDPIALVPAQLTALSTTAARALRRQLPLRGAPDGTVRWQTHGLDPVAAQRRVPWQERPRGVRPPPVVPVRAPRTRIDRIGGLLAFVAAPPELRDHAPGVYNLGRYAHRGMDFVELERPDGEVQVFDDYRHRVSAARAARRELRAEGHDPAAAGFDELVWDRGTAVRRRALRPLAPPAG
ncbi:hypothetical protein Daura_33215 [Dactylosporangium aurantiacum]|uniref:Uncharacterized protein n=1 Tax=Dactylosporangium aurantiacum TaxID=35754 RepID=A0A9Q9IFG5_9ACTN|nr:hypothetical protein [Dactylosporangium aurantiacum]MDG6105054.1 hypothetical protein [Dactylosporangium aurantiacum]UWZ51585.1 hypothetical protein Daura_33215 [Dactylosporangium aurantiacum]